MGYNFEDRQKASEGGKRSAELGGRGKQKIPHELKHLLSEGAMDRLPALWIELDSLKGKDYVSYLVSILKLIIPKDLYIEETTAELNSQDAKKKLVELLTRRMNLDADDFAL